MDLVYIVGPGKRDHLRWSLRSAAANLPHDRVWVVGERPEFLASSVRHLQTARHPVKWRSGSINLRRACWESGISPNFILMNDDFFVMRPVSEVEVLHRGPVRLLLADIRSQIGGASAYAAGMRETLRCLAIRGIREPLSYALHTPMVMNRYRLLETLDTAERIRDPRVKATDLRTMYGNLNGIGGRQVDDVKIHECRKTLTWDAPYVSTSPASWDGPDTNFIREAFPDPCRYEK